MTFRATPSSHRAAPWTVASRMVKRVHALARAKGLDADALARGAGVELAALGDPDARVDVEASNAMLEALDAAAGGPMIGVELALTRDPETYDAAGVVMLAARTLRDGFDRAFRCQVLWGDGERFQRDRDAITFAPAPPGAAHRRAHEIVTECALSEVGLAARFVSPDAIIQRVELAYDARQREELLTKAIGAPVRSAAGKGRSSSIKLSSGTLDAPMPPSALDVLSLTHDAAEETRVKVRRAVARGTVLGDASIATIAAQLAMPPRTLQRRLAASGATFGGIVEEERQRLAHAWLRGGLSIRETASLLGYADKAAFYRAFRKWTGTTPHEARGRAAPRALPSERS